MVLDTASVQHPKCKRMGEILIYLTYFTVAFGTSCMPVVAAARVSAFRIRANVLAVVKSQRTLIDI